MHLHPHINLYDKESKKISEEDGLRQERTVNKLLDLLQDQPGAILADEVGMGKTYVALATALTYISNAKRNKRILVLTPSKELKDKWDKDIDTFRNYCIKTNSPLRKLAKDVGIDTIGKLLGQKSPIVTIPLNKVAGIPNEKEIRCYLGAYFRKRGFSANSRKEMLRKAKIERGLNLPGNITDSFVMSPEQWAFSKDNKDNYWNYENVKKVRSFKPFDDTIRRGEVGKYFIDACRKIRNQLIPEFSFCIIDEAHNYKNPGTLGHRLFNDEESPELTLKNKFEKMIFLTATPFQLGYEELLNIFRMFRAAKTCSSTYDDYIAKVETHLKSYTRAIERFEEAWQRLSLEKGYVVNNEQEITNRREYVDALRAKVSLEPILRKLIIRNIKSKDHRMTIFGSCKNNEKTPYGILMPDKDKPLFFSLLRLEREIACTDRVFNGLTDSMATSSYLTLKASKMLKDTASNKFKGDRAITRYKKIINGFLDSSKEYCLKDEEHPKIQDVVRKVIERYEKGEKSLIFTFYVETAKSLRKEISRELENRRHCRFGEYGIKNIDAYLNNIEKSLTDRNDMRYLVMHENLLLTYGVRPPFPSTKEFEEITILLGRNGFNFSAKSVDYKKLLRCFEHYFIKKAISSKKLQMDSILKRVNSDTYIAVGLSGPHDNTLRDYTEYILQKDHIERLKTYSAIRYILKGPNIWMYHKSLLKGIQDIDLRRTIQTYLLREIKREDFIVQEFAWAYKKKAKGQKWMEIIDRTYSKTPLFNKSFKPETLERRVHRWIEHVVKEYEQYKLDNTEGDYIERLRKLLDIKAHEDVMVIHGKSNVDRSIYFYSFNSPFRPVVLICTSIGSEGIDLQQECSGVFLYDLGWNPAALEQKVGRIDRIGSKNSRERLETDNKKKKPRLEIYRPFIRGTRDERMHKVLQNREKWFNILLGSGERLSSDENGEFANLDQVEREEKMVPPPKKIFYSLTINLGNEKISF